MVALLCTSCDRHCEDAVPLGRGDGDRLDRQLVTEAAEPCDRTVGDPASTEVWRNGSRAAGLERWTSTTTPSNAPRASEIDQTCA